MPSIVDTKFCLQRRRAAHAVPSDQQYLISFFPLLKTIFTWFVLSVTLHNLSSQLFITSTTYPSVTLIQQYLDRISLDVCGGDIQNLIENLQSHNIIFI